MPRAKTGCSVVLYSLLTPAGDKALKRLVAQAPKGIGRPLVLDAVIKRAAKQGLPKIVPPTYRPHVRVKRRTARASA